MKEFWKNTVLWIGLATGSLALLEKAMPLITFPSPFVEALAYVVLVGVGCNFFIGVCREVPAVYQWLYRRTKRGRFVALRNQVEKMIIDLPARNKIWSVFNLADQHRLVALVVELEQIIGIALPIEVPQGHAYSQGVLKHDEAELLQYYEALRAYLGFVHVYILQHDLKGCIEMSHGYREENMSQNRHTA